MSLLASPTLPGDSRTFPKAASFEEVDGCFRDAGCFRYASGRLASSSASSTPQRQRMRTLKFTKATSSLQWSHPSRFSQRPMRPGNGCPLQMLRAWGCVFRTPSQHCANLCPLLCFYEIRTQGPCCTNLNASTEQVARLRLSQGFVQNRRACPNAHQPFQEVILLAGLMEVLARPSHKFLTILVQQKVNGQVVAAMVVKPLGDVSKVPKSARPNKYAFKYFKTTPKKGTLKKAHPQLRVPESSRTAARGLASAPPSSRSLAVALTQNEVCAKFWALTASLEVICQEQVCLVWIISREHLSNSENACEM